MTNFVNNITDMEQRLIDANALLKSLDKQWMRDSYLNNERAEYIRQVMNAVHLAPTVETTDDVMARLPHGTDIEKWKRSDTKEEFYKATHETLQMEERGKTPIEAVTRLEASLNPK